MSIINDAIKKARREFQIKNKDVTNKTDATSISKDASLPESKTVSEASELKRTSVVVASLVLIFALLGSMFLYKYMSRSATPPYNPPVTRAREETPVTLDNIPKEPSPPAAKPRGAIELNGIVYGTEDKWAIINNRIRREGDAVMDGKVSFIAGDFVRIRYDNGEEVVLNLR